MNESTKIVYHYKQPMLLVRKKTLIILLINCILAIVINTNTVLDIEQYALLSFAICICSISLILSCGYRLLSVPILFTALTYIFHCGQFLFNIFVETYDKYFDIYLSAGDNLSISVIKYTSNAIMFLALGFLIMRDRIVVKNDNCVVDTYSFNRCAFCGKLLIIICIVPRILTDLLLIYIGYMGNASGISGYLKTLGEGFYIGIALLLIGRRDKERYCKRVFLITSAYIMLGMISGQRQVALTYWLLIAMVYFGFVITNNETKKVDLVRVLFIGILLYFGLVFLATIGDIRNHPYLEFGDVFLNNISLKMIADQVGEFGGTGISLAYSIKYFPQTKPFNYGMTYVSSLLTVLPNFGGFLTEINFANDYINFIPIKDAFGGSYLGELYYNFGLWGQPLCLLIGMILGKYSNYLNNGIKNEISFRAIIGLLLISPTLLWVRGIFPYFVRTCVWFGIIIYIIFNLYDLRAKN